MPSELAPIVSEESPGAPVAEGAVEIIRRSPSVMDRLVKDSRSLAAFGILLASLVG